MKEEEFQKTFQKVYQSKILPQLDALEQERKETYKKSLMGLLMVVLFGAIAYGIVTFVNSLLVPMFIILFAFIIFIVISTSSAENKYNLKLKNQLLMQLFSIFGNFIYTKNEDISLKEIKEDGLFPLADSKKDDDIIIGKYKDIDIAITETRIFHQESSSAESNDSNNSFIEKEDFRGLIIKIKMNKNFTGQTVIRQRPVNYEQFLNNMKLFQENSNGAIPNWIMNITDNPIIKNVFKAKQFMAEKGISMDPNGGIILGQNMGKAPKHLEEVTLENTKFNEIFQVFSSDQVEARFLLTPTFMERFLSISTTLFTLNTNCIFKNGNIILFLGESMMNGDLSTTNDRNINPNDNNITAKDSYGYFEFGSLSDTLYNEEIFKNVFRQLITIFDLIYHFKLEQKIGM